MKILRAFVVGLMSLLCAAAVTGLVWAITLQATVLQPAVVKGWLRDSNIYSQLVSTVVPAPEVPENTLITPDVVSAALDKTFSSEFVQQQTEQTLDRAYNWLDGQTPTFSFSIPVDQQRTAFIEQLGISLQPKVAALPTCTTRAQIAALDGSCRPAGMSVEIFAKEVATQAATRTTVLDEPITEQTLATLNPSAQSDAPLLEKLPAVTQVARLALAVLPIIIAASIGIIFLTAANRLHAFRQLGRRICLTSVFTLGGAAVLAYFAGGGTLPMFDTPSNPLVELLAPVLGKAIGSITMYLLILSGIIVVLSGTLWIYCAVLEGKREREILSPPNNPQINATNTSHYS